MKLNRLKNNITYLFLVLFLSTKIAGLHAMMHIDDKDHVEDCSICDHVILCNLTPTITPCFIDFNINIIEFVIQKEESIIYSFIGLNKRIPKELFSRPPPFLI